MLIWGPGYQWPPLRSCRFPLHRSPSSPPPQCTDGLCKAPWSARACGHTQQLFSDDGTELTHLHPKRHENSCFFSWVGTLLIISHMHQWMPIHEPWNVSFYHLDTWALSPFQSQQQEQAYFVTTLILTPNTPLCFLDGVLFKLRSRLVNFMENSTLIWGGTNNIKKAKLKLWDCYESLCVRRLTSLS